MAEDGAVDRDSVELEERCVAVPEAGAGEGGDVAAHTELIQTLVYLLFSKEFFVKRRCYYFT